jgi:hypothetical protein
MKQNRYLKSVVLLIAGLLILGYGIFLPFQPKSMLASENIAIMDEGIVTTGEIISVRKTMQKDPDQESSPDAKARLYEIVTAKYSVDSKNYETTGSRPLQNPGWEKRNPIKITYKIDDPKVSVVSESGVAGVDDYPHLSLALIFTGILLTSTGIVFRLRRDA